MPRIIAPTLAEHRDLRRSSLLQAARDLVMTEGTRSVTMAAVASRAGLSRPAVYEYYPSSEALLGAVLMAEMASWADDVAARVEAAGTADEKLATYVRVSLQMVADGRHDVAGRITPSDIDAPTLANLMKVHHRLAAPLVDALAELGVADAEGAAMLVQGVVQAAGRRIEQGAELDAEQRVTLAFAQAGVGALAGLDDPAPPSA